MKRREMIKKTGAALLGATVAGIPAFAQGSENKDNNTSKRKKAVIVGAHPDDPESVFGGTMLALKAAGWDVVSIYMTKGEAGIKGKTNDEAAAIRRVEAENACKVLGVKPVFLTQIDGSSEINKERYTEMKEAIAAENPDIVFTHWPIDSHADHRVCASLVYDAWRRLGYTFELYYGEAMTGLQSQSFHPTDYVDISDFAAKKREALFCHVSQDPEGWVDDWHGNMAKFRGREIGVADAEAFVHLKRGKGDII
ncbi:MAG: PIG-L family deacetylase [Bacteroidales bacterium]|nr:PIG-L family deacetylase [Bacteroidales bacterium]